MGKYYNHLTIEERRRIAACLKRGISVAEIARQLGRAYNTIRNELKRGTVRQYVDYEEIYIYFPDTGQIMYEKHRAFCKKERKIKECTAFLRFVEEGVLTKKWSIEEAVHRAEREGFSKAECVCTTTLYAYIDSGDLKVRNIDLPEKVSRRQKPKKDRQPRKNKTVLGTSIEKRADHVADREEFGHWEIDLVIGKRDEADCVMTLVERKSRRGIYRKIKSKKAKNINRVLKKVFKEYGDQAKDVFKSITSDNGSEFSQLFRLEKSGIGIYFCHPYSSWERGSNENQNRMVRRFIPKGKSMKKFTGKRIVQIEERINSKPRKILGWLTAQEVFDQELSLLKV